ncbi:MAG: hypothetical protein CMO55_11360 [Verrucomicrobiales bacterium]|nr:hypothetical protein [Verrucomicrobiales bacterium]
MPGRLFDFYFVPLLLFILLVGNSFARDLHVDPESGDDSNDGVALPVRSISRGIALAGPDDTVHLKPTVYYDYAGFYRKQGEAGRPVILDGHGATLEGSDTIDPDDWKEVEPGLYRSTVLPPHWNEAVLARWFFLFADTMQRMDRVLKGKSAPLKQPYELGAGEWTFVRNEGAAEDDWSGTFYLKIADGKTLAESEIRWPVRSAGVQFSGDNGHLVIRNLTATHPHNDGFNIHGDC